MKKLSYEEVLAGMFGALIYGLFIAGVGHFVGENAALATLATGLFYWLWCLFKLN